MSDREALIEALDWVKKMQPPLFSDPVVFAAWERLTQLYELCGTCWGSGYQVIPGEIADYTQCPTCYGFGRVYPAGTVHRIAEVLHDYQWKNNVIRAIAVLEALNGEPS